MAEPSIELPGTAQRSEGLSDAPAAIGRLQWVRRLSAKVGLFQVAYVVVAGVMLVNLLVLNNLQDWVKVVQAVSGSACGLIGGTVGGLSLIVSGLRAKIACIVFMYFLASVSLSILDSQFSKALDSTSEISFQVPSFYGVLAIATTLPAFFKQETVGLVLVGSMMNAIAFAFQLASYHTPEPILSFVVFEVAILSQAMTFSTEPRKLTTVVDLSKTTTFAQHDEAVGSELETIIHKLQKVHTNAEEAIAAARTTEELQRASESEMLMRDLMTRLKTRNVYSISPERLTMNMSREEKTYIEENYLPPLMPKVRRRDRLQSSNG